MGSSTAAPPLGGAASTPSTWARDAKKANRPPPARRSTDAVSTIIKWYMTFEESTTPSAANKRMNVRGSLITANKPKTVTMAAMPARSSGFRPTLSLSLPRIGFDTAWQR